MYRVLLVDDEPLARHNLRTLTDWRGHGFELCGEAYNGALALEMIGQFRPHVVILDVSMPEMDGVELNRTIRERYPAVRTIMLSSYDDYDYVRECLMNGAVDYLLKHRLDERTLLAVLNKAVRDVRGDGKQPERAESRDPAAVREPLADLARGRPGAASELAAHAKRLGLYPQAVGFAAAVVQLIPFLLLTESLSDVQTNRLVQRAVDIVQQSLGDPRERTAAYAGEGRLIVVFAFKERSERAAVSEAERLLGVVKHSLELFLNLHCIYALGHVCGSLLQLGASIGSAERALELAEGGEPAGARKRRASLTIEEQQQLLLHFERLDEEGIRRLIASLFASLQGLPPFSRTVQTIVSELLHAGDKAWKKWMPAAGAAAAELPSRSGIGKLGSLGELERWLQSYFAQLLRLLKPHRASGPYSRHVTQAIQLILDHYHDGITLERAAGAIGLNPSYLSRIFKEETRSTFSEYVSRVRIEASCRLLESGRFSIKEVCRQVGFSSYNYFFKVFKELTGRTPHAYLTRPGAEEATVKEVE